MTTEQMDWLDDERAGRHKMAQPDYVVTAPAELIEQVKIVTANGRGGIMFLPDGMTFPEGGGYDDLRTMTEKEADDNAAKFQWGPIPRYAMLDIWMALFGSHFSEEFERHADSMGYAELWAWICGKVRARSDDQLDAARAEAVWAHEHEVKAERVTDQEEHAHYTRQGREWCAAGNHEAAEILDRDLERAKVREKEAEDNAKDARGEPKHLDPADYVTMAEEPIEQRLRRAWLNGFREGVDRAANSVESWGRWDS